MLTAIGVFKILKAVLLLVAATGLLRLLNRPDAADALRSWAIALHLNPGARHLGRLLERLGTVDESTLRRLRVGAFVYAGLLLIEGIGLVLQQRWAEYVTIVITASFIPLELYEVSRHVTFIRIVALAVNVAIVVYLVARLKRGAALDTSRPTT